MAGPIIRVEDLVKRYRGSEGNAVDGVSCPTKFLPLYLGILSHVSPIRYDADLTRSALYTGRRNEYDAVVLASPLTNMEILGAMSAVFLLLGTTLFVRREKNR